MGRNDKHFKWPSFSRQYLPWWDSLTDLDKAKYKDNFERVRQASMKARYPYPDMYDLTGLRLSQLSEKHICRIWTFKDKTS